ncbi:hypothetical protein J6590_052023 [Homalodisca vitripennis]|nr:hypothetical protein J6590_052023 [Homalodisca vitripennis]
MSKRTLDNSLQGESRELMMGRRGMHFTSAIAGSPKDVTRQSSRVTRSTSSYSNTPILYSSVQEERSNKHSREERTSSPLPVSVCEPDLDQYSDADQWNMNMIDQQYHKNVVGDEDDGSGSNFTGVKTRRHRRQDYNSRKNHNINDNKRV